MAGQTIGSLLVRIGSDINPMIRGLRKAERELTRTAQKMQSMGERMTVGLTLPLAGIGGAAVKSAAQFEQLEASLSILTGSAEEGAKVFERLKKFAATTPFELGDIVNAEKQLLAFGFSVENSFNALQYLGDIAAATGGDLNGLTTILGQAKAIGAVYTQDLRQLANRGIPIFDVLQKQLQVTGEELNKMVTDGQIDFATLEDALKSMTQEGGLFFQGMQKQSQTTAGAFSNFQDSVNLILADFGKSIMEAFNVRENLVKFSNWLQGLQERFNNLNDAQKKAIIIFASVVAAIGPLLIITAQLIKSYAVINTLYGIQKLKMLALIKTAGGLNAAMLLVAQSIKTATLAMLTSPAGLFVITLTGLVIVLSKLYNSSDAARVTIDALGTSFASAERKAVAYGNAIGYIVASIYGKTSKGSTKPAQVYQAGFELSDSFMSGARDGLEKGNILLISEEQRRELQMQRLRKEQAEKRRKQQEKEMAEARAKAKEQAKELRIAWAEATKGMSSFGAISFTNTSFLGQIQNTFSEPKINKAMQDYFDRIGANAEKATDKIKAMGQALAENVRRGADSAAEGIQGFAGELARLDEKAREFWETYGAAISSLGSSIQQAFQMREDRLNQYYDTELKRIEQSRMSEEGKQKAIQRLEEETDKKRRKMARQAAIREKALAIVQATIGTALAVIDAIKKSNYVLAALNAAAGAAQIGVIASQSIPALAGGGLAYAPTMAMVGDNRGARVDPEVIAPLSKLRDYMGGAQNVIVTGRISGRDILLVQERAQQDRERVRGF